MGGQSIAEEWIGIWPCFELADNLFKVICP